MDTVNLIVGNKYIIHGNECMVTYNGIGFKAIIINGLNKGLEISGVHGKYNK